MNEKQYRVQKFAEWAPTLAGHRVALYGTAANAAAILEAYPDYPILCLIDKVKPGRYMYGKVVVTLEEAATLDIDVIILATQISSEVEVYNRISMFCKNHNIQVYDLYGKNMHQLFRNMLTQKIEFPQMDVEKMYQRCCEFPVVSFGILDTLMSRCTGDSNEFYALVQQESEKKGIHGNLKELRQDANFSFMRSDNLFPRLAARMGLPASAAAELAQIEFEQELACAVPRPTMVSLLNRLVEEGKRVYVVSDLPWQEQQLVILLKQLGCSDQVRCIPRDINVGKRNGLYRTLLEREANQKILHIGANEMEDFVAASAYGIEAAWIPTAFSLMQSTSYRVSGTILETEENRRIVGDFYSHTYADPFCLQAGNEHAEPDTVRILAMSKIMGDAATRQVVIPKCPVLFPSFEVDEESKVGKLVVPSFEKPRVSIVIPVYNQFVYTYNCIRSVIANSGDVPYEILVADDCSTDQVAYLEQFVEGAVILHNKENLRFLRNCNHAAQQARGEFILFLNNDTQVQKDWLAPLVALMDQDDSIGMVGAKLIYPDGYLQEAGGILWQDGSAWNYGNRKNPDESEYNYVREVDYISGAAIMIRTSLWHEIGGFDERFAPAYCEDSDLAFEVRRHGKKVVFQPLSVVVHFEGVSNGTDTSTGQKAYQVINQKKFYEKWHDVLEKEHFPNGENVFQARDRSRHKKTVLIVNDVVPTYDKDAGARTVYQYTRLFIQRGYNVKYIPDNFYAEEPYTTALEQLGVEVLYGPWYAGHWREWYVSNCDFIQYAFLNRPHIAVKYMNLLRNVGKTRIIYYGHDLHFMRLEREAELTGDDTFRQESEKMRPQELELIRKADISFYPSEVEVSVLKAIDPELRVKAMPAYIFNQVDHMPYKAQERNGVFFIGGYAHRPNKDAVQWFIQEILPIVKQEIPDFTFHMLGSRASQELVDLAGRTPGVIYEGPVSDEQLAQFYRRCRISVAPLRYGAGIKGKVVEAMSMGIPVMTTSCGAEGILNAEQILCIADDPVEFARRLVALYQDAAELHRRSEAARAYIEANFSPDNAWQVVGSEFGQEGTIQ